MSAGALAEHKLYHSLFIRGRRRSAATPLSAIRPGLAIVLLLLSSSFAFAQSSVDRVLVFKKQHKLLLLDGDTIVKSYSVALGRGGLAPKRWQGDRKTPEGLYRIDARNPASQFHLALHISYPQDRDKQYARRVGLNPGGDIMIHGLGRNYSWVGAKHLLDDWTDGCIAVTDEEIEEIWRLVPVGTPVEIRP